MLPEGPALQLLLRDDSRHPVRDDPDHPERSEARAICQMLGYLPLALELASAFLAEWPEVSLADYRKRLGEEGLPADARCRGREPGRGQLPADSRSRRRCDLEDPVGGTQARR